MVATPSASLTSTTSLVQEIHRRFSLAKRLRDEIPPPKQIREILNQMKALSRQLSETATLFQKSQIKGLDTHHTIQESLRPTTLSMATGVGVGVGGIQSHSHAPHAVGESPSVTRPSPTTESVSTPPEVVIDEFPSDSETTRSVSFSWAVDNQKDIYALMVLSLTGGIIVIYSPQEIKLVSPVVGGIVGSIVSLIVSEIYLGDG